MTALLRSTPPSVESVAAMIESADRTAASTLRQADDALVRPSEVDGRATDATGYATEHTAEVRAVTVTWTWHGHVLGSRPKGATVVQVIDGGRSSGEGYATAPSPRPRYARPSDSSSPARCPSRPLTPTSDPLPARGRHDRPRAPTSLTTPDRRLHP